MVMVHYMFNTFLCLLLAVDPSTTTASKDHISVSAARRSLVDRKLDPLFPGTHNRSTKSAGTMLVSQLEDVRGGGTVAKAANAESTLTQAQNEMIPRFKTGASRREKSLAIWLLLWNSVAFADAMLFTFSPKRNLDGYLNGAWGPHTLAMTRMLANCQWGLILSTTLIALKGNEAMIKNMFKILIFCTLGAFRAIGLGVTEGTIKAPWKTGQALLMSAPPLLILLYFAFVF